MHFDTLCEYILPFLMKYALDNNKGALERVHIVIVPFLFVLKFSLFSFHESNPCWRVEVIFETGHAYSPNMCLPTYGHKGLGSLSSLRVTVRG